MIKRIEITTIGDAFRVVNATTQRIDNDVYISTLTIDANNDNAFDLLTRIRDNDANIVVANDDVIEYTIRTIVIVTIDDNRSLRNDWKQYNVVRDLIDDSPHVWRTTINVRDDDDLYELYSLIRDQFTIERKSIRREIDFDNDDVCLSILYWIRQLLSIDTTNDQLRDDATTICNAIDDTTYESYWNDPTRRNESIKQLRNALQRVTL